jgi:hypothetical protein
MEGLFEAGNSEELVSVSRLSLKALDRMAGSMPPDEPIPAGELAALIRLVGASLALGLALPS